MASKNNINSVFTDIANSIRAKKGTTNTIQPINMSEEIDGIPTGGSEDRLKKLLDTTKSTYYLFYYYKGTSVDDLIQYSDTENVTNMSYMFQLCKNFTTIPQLDTSKVTNMSYMLDQCIKLQTIPQLNTSNVTKMNVMFGDCYDLQTVPQLDTSKVTNMQSMFYGCYNLTTVHQLNMINVTNTSSMFYGCKKLTNLTLLNIKVDLQIGSGTSYGHLLTLDSLINNIKELVNVGASRTLTMGSANLEKIANVYVRRTATGDIPTCLSDNSNIDLAKGPCEVCESTDEGAMLITAYANSKNWTLA